MNEPLSRRHSPSHKTLVVVGEQPPETLKTLRQASAGAEIPTELVARPEDLPACLAAHDPLAVIVRMAGQGGLEACVDVRGRSSLSHVPILGLSRDCSDLDFTELFSTGGDDLVNEDVAQPLLRRLRSLLTSPARPLDEARSKGRAVVVGPDPVWRTMMRRALVNGGLEVDVKENGRAALEASAGARFVVAADDLDAGGAIAWVSEARDAGNQVPWVIVAPPKRMGAVRAAAKVIERAAVADAFAPTENVLFVANDLIRSGGVDNRKSARMLYGTTVAFRVAGRDSDEVGFTYNISAGGLYVRTLAAPEQGQEVWLELWPPRSERRVRLAGKVAWRRPFGANETATVPAGFGLELTDGLSGDLDRWSIGYEAYAHSLTGERTVKAS